MLVLPSVRVLCRRSYRSFASRSIFEPCLSAESTEGGLYGFEILKSAKGFRVFVDEAIERSNELIGRISQLPPSENVIQAMDEISDVVCSVVDSAELCRHTHPDRDFVEAASEASTRMFDYLHFLNTNYDLYNAVVKSGESGLLKSEEAQRAAHMLRLDFEKGGIHLSVDKLQRVNQLNTVIAQLGREFNENISADPGFVDVYPASRIPKHVQYLLVPVYRSSSIMKNSFNANVLREKGYRIRTDSATLASILKWVPDDEVRKQSYISGHSVPHANLAVLDKLIAARHELAQIMGCKSFAEFAVHPNMASSPAVVWSFLLELGKIIKDKADQEFKAIRDFKMKMCNKSAVELEPWDEAYFTGIMKSSSFSVDPCVVASYFPLSQCIEGLKMIVKSLFGASFCTIPFSPGESWHPDVLKFSLHHPEEGDMGYIYLDLYSRKGKIAACAHFAIKGARWVSESEYQLPVVALVCNFSCRRSSATLLNHWELETLFHEFGHALHSLLSRTKYQHFSGTRVVIDFAEIPANLFEYFSWDYRVLRMFARHYSTGETIPEELVRSMNSAKQMFAATELQRQIFYALIDQRLFGEPFCPPGDSTSIVSDLKRQYTSWSHVEGTHWHTRFSHLVNYGGGYYSYLYAKCFSSTIWQEICLEAPLSLATGSTLRAKLLQHGGAKDPACLLQGLLGNGALRFCNGGVVPNISHLCNELNL